MRASGHTFEYLGYGPGNYSTALPQVQNITLTEREEFLSQSQEKAGGLVVYTGMNNKGDFFIGNQKKSSATGEEVTYDTPVATVTGEDPARLSMVTDEITVKERILVEGGKSQQILSQFDGPVTFTKDVRLNGSVSFGNQLRVKNDTQSNSTTSGALIVTGGVGIGKNLHVGGNVNAVNGVFSGDLSAVNITATGTIAAASFSGDISGSTGLPVPGGNIGTTFYDNVKCSFGDALGADLEIFHDTTKSIIRDTGTGKLFLQTDEIIYVTQTNGTTISAEFDTDAGVSLNYNGTKRFETIDGGAKVTGELQVTDDITAFYSSDRRLKDNISPIKQALDKVKSLSGNTFDWNEASGKEGSDTGVIAQEVEALNLPGVTTIRDDGTHAVRYERLVPVLIEAVKELSAKVDNLEQKLSDK